MTRRFIFLLAPSVLAAANLADRIESAAQASTVAKRAFWGAHAVNLSTGQTLYSYNSERFFVPASNTKLFSTALALTRLGPNYRYATTLAATARVDEAGTLEGDLRLIGGGDPSLSGRPVPYVKFARSGDPAGPIEALVEAAWQAGLRHVKGDVVGDDSAYVWDPYPPGWSFDDTLFEYGAPVSALVLHDNTVNVDVRGADKNGDPAAVEIRPPSSYFVLDAHVATGAEPQRVQVERGLGPRNLTIWGSVRRADGVSIPVAVPDPAHYAAYVLREMLERRGIRVDGEAKARHRYYWQNPAPREAVPFNGRQPATSAIAEPQAIPENLTVLATRQSPPLFELLKIVNKVSQNLHAELILREVARARGEYGSRRAALADMTLFLRRAGIPATDVSLYDGSGLSRLTLATPSAFTTLLRHMYASPNKQVWLSTLPIGGEDGTLSMRFRGQESARVLAKTGSLTNVSALSGYIENARSETIAFSIIVNNANVSPGAVRSFIDNVVKLLAE